MFLYSNWRKLPLPTRTLVAQVFNIPKVGSTHVSDNQVVSDGYNIEDVERALNVDAIQKYIGIEVTDLEVLWDLMVAKVMAPDEPIIEPAPAPIVPEVVPIPSPKKRGRPAGKITKPKK